MTVSSTTRKAGPFAGNNVITSFPFTFKVFDKTDIVLYRVDSNGVPTTLTLDSDYSVALNADQNNAPGGTITYPKAGTPLPTGQTLVVLGNTPFDQETDITNSGGFYPSVIEDMVDKSTIQIQQLEETLSRAILVGPADTTTATLPNAAARANTILGFDATGNLETLPITSSVGAGDLRTDIFISDILPNPLGLPTFTAGTTVSLALSRAPGSVSNTQTHFDAAFQGPDQVLSLNSATLTYTAPIPVGVSNVYVTSGTTLSLYVPPNGSVGTPQLQAKAVGTAQIADHAVGVGQLDPAAIPAILQTTSVYQPETGNFFFDLGARVQRFNDRVFIGTASEADGKSTQTPGVGDWTFQNFKVGGVSAFGYLEQNSQFNVGARNGQLAGVFASRTSDDPTGFGGAIGVSSVVLNDNSLAPGTSAWGFYGTVVRGAGNPGQSTLGMELDVCNMGPFVSVAPNNLFARSVTANLWIAAGGELANQAGGGYTFNKVSCAMAIFANEVGYPACVYDKGIVFGSNAFDANGYALNLYVGHQMAWWNAANQQVAGIKTTATTTASGQQIEFTGFGTEIKDMSGNVQFAVSNSVTGGAANYLTIVPALAGASPVIGASGTDTNVDLQLFTQGAGVLKFGTYTGGAPAATGYITIKETNGTVRKLLAA